MVMVFHHHNNPEVRFVLSRVALGANSTILLVCIISLVLSSHISFVGCRSLPPCGCYDGFTGLRVAIRVFNSPVNFSDRRPEEEEAPSKHPSLQQTRPRGIC